MNKFLKIGIICGVLVVVAVLADYLANQNTAFTGISVFEPRPLPFDRININTYYYSYIGDMELYYKVKTVLSSINATLLVVLLATYFDIYIKLKSEFTFGLIVFSLILLLYALSSNPLFQWLFGYQAFGLGPFAMLPDMFTSLALVVLLYLTMK
jgi:hypothetical protein